MHRTIHVLRQLAATAPLPVLLASRFPPGPPGSSNSATNCATTCTSARQEQQDLQGKVLYLIRHAQAEHNVVDSASLFQRRQDPALADPWLTRLGVDQATGVAADLRQKLSEHQDEEPAVVVSSTLRRALQTAELGVLPVAPQASLIALESACEIQFWDIWNEPRVTCSVQAEWPAWKIESCSNVWSECGKPPLETADHMIFRAEAVWERLAQIQSPVIVFVSHGCFLEFFVRRIALASDGNILEDTSELRNGEVRRIRLPSPDGRRLQWLQLVEGLAQKGSHIPKRDVSFWIQFGERANAIIKAGPDALPRWAAQEWRYAVQDESLNR